MTIPDTLLSRHETDAPSPAAAKASQLDRIADLAIHYGLVNHAERLARRAEAIREEAPR